jgi:hypothetical protein
MMQMDSFNTTNKAFAAFLKALTTKDGATKQPPKKRVRFSSYVSSSPAPNKLTRKEKKSLWYDTQTMLSFRSRTRKLALSMEKKEHA